MFISVLGDSISTYEGYNPAGYAVYYNEYVRFRNGLADVRDTWWARTMKHFDWDLCVNNAYSGSRVTGNAFPSASSDERLTQLRTDSRIPDLILVYMGFNDFGYGVDVGKEKRFFPDNQGTFSGAYRHMLLRMRELYPNTIVVCGTIMRSRLKDRPGWQFPEIMEGSSLETYNQAIRNACRKADVCLADLSETGQRYETLDGAHPTADGHDTIARAWVACLERLGIQRCL